MAAEAADYPRRSRGVAIMLIGVLAISPDALLVRLMREELRHTAADPSLQIMFWKYAFVFVWHSGFTVYHERGRLRSIRAGRRYILGGAALQFVISLSLNLAFLHTQAARALLFFALSPLWAALLARLALSERLPLRTRLALLLAFAAVAMVLLPSIAPAMVDDGTGAPSAASSNLTPAAAAAATAAISASLHGDLFGVAAGAALGAILVVGRAAKLRAPDVPMLACVLLGSCLVVVATLTWQLAAGRASMGAVSPRFLGLALLDSLCVCIVYVATVLAPRHAPSADVALINLLETVLGPMWVFLGTHEAPSRWTLLGGGALLLVLAAHEGYGLARGWMTRARCGGPGRAMHSCAVAAPPAHRPQAKATASVATG